MGFYGEPRGIEEVPENPRRFNESGMQPDSIFHRRVDGDCSESMSSIPSQRRQGESMSQRILETTKSQSIHRHSVGIRWIADGINGESAEKN
jgi:hypothetical protein